MITRTLFIVQSPAVLDVLVKTFDIAPIATPEADINAALG